MPKIMIINVTHAEESRVGIVTNNVLTSFEIESFSREHLKGNLYKGVVHRIHQALEAAFVDIGADRDAFLPLDEICFRNLSNPPPKDNGNGERRRPRITDVLKPGQEILVQIIKEQFANKPPTLSTYYSLAGRYLVLLPGSDETGISRRIEGAERERLREMVDKLEAPKGFGVIVRTVAGFDQGERELQRDLTYLKRLWDSIQQAGGSKRGPALIYREHDLVLRNIRDYFTPDIDEVWIDNDEVFQRARDFFRDVMPEREDVLRLYEGDKPIFSQFNVEGQIESIYKRRVPLKSGGSIVIDGTEALTAIDVNSGRSVRGGTQEETAFKTNLEAANEIARQLRLRDLGGLIVIDFIDMRAPQHVQEVERALRAAMHEDKARHELGHISQFGLLEVSRQRLRPAAAATSYAACPRCDGYGLVRTTESASLVALRKIHLRVAQGDVSALKVSLPAEVGLYLLNQKREDLAQLERRYAVRLQVVLSDKLMPHQSEMETRPRVEAEGQPRLGGVTVGEPADIAAPTEGSPAEPGPLTTMGASLGAAHAASTAEPLPSPNGQDPGKRKKRRGRRRGRGKAAAAAIGEALATLGLLAGLGTGPAEASIPAGSEPEGSEDEQGEYEEYEETEELVAPSSDSEGVADALPIAVRASSEDIESDQDSPPVQGPSIEDTADVSLASDRGLPTEESPPMVGRTRRGRRGGRGRGRRRHAPSTSTSEVGLGAEVSEPVSLAPVQADPTVAPHQSNAANPESVATPVAEAEPMAVTDSAVVASSKTAGKRSSSGRTARKKTVPAKKRPAKKAAKTTVAKSKSRKPAAKQAAKKTPSDRSN